jgi:hypothetical protein
MLLTREEEIRIILVSLANREMYEENQINKMKEWAIKTNTDLNNYDFYLETKNKLVILDKKIKTYKKLLSNFE